MHRRWGRCHALYLPRKSAKLSSVEQDLVSKWDRRAIEDYSYNQETIFEGSLAGKEKLKYDSQEEYSMIAT